MKLRFNYSTTSGPIKLKLKRIMPKAPPKRLSATRRSLASDGNTVSTQRSGIVDLKENGKTGSEIGLFKGIPKSTVNAIYVRAKERTYEPHRPLQHFSIYEDRPRSGRPSWPSEHEKDKIFLSVISTQEQRKKTAEQHIREMDLKGQEKDENKVQKPLSKTTFVKIMSDRGYRRGKRGWKPHLSNENKARRLAWALKYLEFDFCGRAVSTDEAKARRHEHYKRRIWLCAGEELHPDVVGGTRQEDDKSMCQISGHLAWGPGGKGKLIFLHTETEEEKIEAEIALEQENKDYEPMFALAFHAAERQKEEIAAAGGPKPKGKKPSLEVYQRNMAKKRGDRKNGGVDGYRYREEILRAGVIPFCKRLNQEGRNVVVMEDGAGNHTCKMARDLYRQAMITVFDDWPPNSPDLNPIEKAWDWCRKYLQDKDFHAKNSKELEAGWREAWDALPQETINTWFESMKDVCEKVIAQNGDNKFHR